mmetsp:Transcript_2553/g.8193  ORF Transcript_2553/g.8193 Transcript_2553/m.8193 type:complete len:200 (+) Transcript_2553:982-1581(+)
MPPHSHERQAPGTASPGPSNPPARPAQPPKHRSVRRRGSPRRAPWAPVARPSASSPQAARGHTPSPGSPQACSRSSRPLRTPPTSSCKPTMRSPGLPHHLPEPGGALSGRVPRARPSAASSDRGQPRQGPPLAVGTSSLPPPRPGAARGPSLGPRQSESPRCRQPSGRPRAARAAPALRGRSPSPRRSTSTSPGSPASR